MKSFMTFEVEIFCFRSLPSPLVKMVWQGENGFPFPAG